MNYKKAKWEELELGKIFYATLADCETHKLIYKKVKILDLTDKKVIYQYEDGWKEYINKSQWSEIYLEKEDEQLTLF